MAGLLGLTGRLPDKVLADPMSVKLMAHPATELEITLREEEGKQAHEAASFELTIQLHCDDPVICTRIYTAAVSRLCRVEGLTFRAGSASREKMRRAGATVEDCRASLAAVAGGGPGYGPEFAGGARAQLAAAAALRRARALLAGQCSE